MSKKNFFGVTINKTFFWLKKNAQFFRHFPTYMKIYNHGNFGQDSSFRLATFNFKNWSNMLFGQWANLFNLLCRQVFGGFLLDFFLDIWLVTLQNIWKYWTFTLLIFKPSKDPQRTHKEPYKRNTNTQQNPVTPLKQSKTQ